MTFRSVLAVGTALVIGFGAWGLAQAKQEKDAAVTSASEIRSAPAFSKTELKEGTTEGWITNGGTLFNQRYSPLEQINRDNVEESQGRLARPSERFWRRAEIFRAKPSRSSMTA